MIKPHSREQLSADDLEFLVEVLRVERATSDSFVQLLTEPNARDAALDDDRLLYALLERPEVIRVSPRLYFYVLARRALAGFDRTVADYVANMLTAFIDMQRLRDASGGFVTEMLSALQAVSSDRAFWIRAQIGNYSLFLAGIFPDHIQHRATTRGAPDIGFYEEIGSINYQVASSHRLARAHALEDVFQAIAQRFAEVRLSLNRLADQHLCLEPIGSMER